MNTRLASVLCIALAAAPACKKSEKSGPAVARVGDEVITADEVRQRLNDARSSDFAVLAATMQIRGNGGISG